MVDSLKEEASPKPPKQSSKRFSFIETLTQQH